MSVEEWLGAGLPEAVVDDAINWIVQLDDADVPPEVTAAFLLWLEAAPDNRAAYDELSQAWSRTRGLQRVSDQLLRSKVIHLPSDARRAAIYRSPPLIAPMAMVSWVALAFIVAGLIFGSR